MLTLLLGLSVVKDCLLGALLIDETALLLEGLLNEFKLVFNLSQSAVDHFTASLVGVAHLVR